MPADDLLTGAVDGVRPGELAALVDGAASGAGLVATLLDLARRGRVEVVELGEGDRVAHDWTLVRSDGPSDALGGSPEPSRAERLLLAGLFPGGRATTTTLALRALLDGSGADVLHALDTAVVEQGWRQPGRLRRATHLTPTGERLLAHGLRLREAYRSARPDALAGQVDAATLVAHLPSAVALGADRTWTQVCAALVPGPPDWYRRIGDASPDAFWTASLPPLLDTLASAASTHLVRPGPDVLRMRPAGWPPEAFGDVGPPF
ncbi:hypothetical protein [Cellulomonas massiliensis]|uniref:hypothetical protein n=1 Tax=Cellulomonas massiliensis TaxID=1465811 RepID=UPI0002F650B7|nr:hypothetical protein [Cellulomonas massiliensis]